MSPGGSDDSGGLPAASLGESLRFVGAAVVPSLVRGLFSPRRRAMRWLTSIDTDRRAVEVLSGIRRNHPGEGVRLLGGRMVTLWGAAAIKEVLDRSADVYASDSGAKGRGMAHFQPDALTLSRRDEWRDRRAFNQSVLASSERAHPLAASFLAVVADEVERLRLSGTLTWADFEGLFDHITLRVIFGDRARDDRELTDSLEQLMAEANRIVGLGDSDLYHRFYGQLERHLVDPEPGSLVSRFADAPQSDQTRVVQQIPHWIFAMRDTLAANSYRAIAAIVSDPEVERRVREEIEGANLADPAALGELRYLEGCLQEAMRLWPTTPLLARETISETTLAGEHLKAGTQVMIVNAFNHRDRERDADADRLNPERWISGSADDYRLNHLSHGSQDCPGGPMVLLLGKAVIAAMLSTNTLALRESVLEPGSPLPHMLNFFELSFVARPAG